jgi:uncharacterized membrane protein YhaH (DUF805 family)
MDNLMGLFTSTEGRIGRGRWWLGIVILIVIGLIISAILSLFGLGMWSGVGAIDPSNPEAMAAAVSSATRSAAWGGLISFVILAWPSYALSIKRRHDRGSNGLDLQIYYGLSFIMLLVSALGVGLTTTEIGNGISIPTPSLPMVLLQAIIGIYGIYLLVVMGFLSGTPGTNQYGANPLGAPAGAAA